VAPRSPLRLESKKAPRVESQRVAPRSVRSARPPADRAWRGVREPGHTRAGQDRRASMAEHGGPRCRRADCAPCSNSRLPPRNSPTSSCSVSRRQASSASFSARWDRSHDEVDTARPTRASHARHSLPGRRARRRTDHRRIRPETRAARPHQRAASSPQFRHVFRRLRSPRRRSARGRRTWCAEPARSQPTRRPGRIQPPG
jgi:hypothetical protein